MFHFSLPLPSPSLHLCHCCHVCCFLQRNCCCHCPLLFCPRTNCRLFAIYVCCSYLSTFPRLLPIGIPWMQQARIISMFMTVTRLPCIVHKLVLLKTSSIPQPPGEPGELCSAFAGHSFWILVQQSLVQDAGRGLSWWGDLLFFGTHGSPLLPPFLGASGEAFSWQLPFTQPLVQPFWLNVGMEVLPQ
jgi:hypothetical protein